MLEDDEIGIRDATLTDLPSIVAIYNATVAGRQSTADLEPVSVVDRRPWFERHSPDRHPLWAVDAGNQLVAWLSLEPWNQRPAYARSAEVSVYVDERARGRGLGRMLLERAIARGPDLGLSNLIVVIFSHNGPSLRLFEDLGFERWGRLPGIAELDGVERDVLILGRRLGDR